LEFDMPASTAIASLFAPASPAAAGNAPSSVSNTDNDGVFASLVQQSQATDAATANPLLAVLAGVAQSTELQDAATPVAASLLSPELRNLLATAGQGTQENVATTETPTAPSDNSALALLMAQFQQPQPVPEQTQPVAQAGSNDLLAQQQLQQAASGKDQTAILDALASIATSPEPVDPAFAQLVQNAAQKAKGTPSATGNEPPTATSATLDAEGQLQGPATVTDTRSAITQTAQGQGNNLMQNGTSGGADLSKPFDPSLQAASSQGQPQFQVELTKAQHTVVSGPLLPQVPLENLAVQIARRFEQGMSSFEISLSPAELGRLDISMQVSDDGRVHAVLRAERPETLELLKQDARALETQLRQAGLDVGSNALSFQLSHGNAHRQNSAARNNGFSSALDDGQQPAEQVTSYVATRKRDGVDIHV
jgi:flagellar hook-length control protein FliK